MKIVKYIVCALMLVAAVSCQKHQILYDTTPISTTGKTAEFQLHFFVPQTTAAAQYIDSTFINGVLYSSVKGSGSLVPLNGIPGGTVGRFFAVKPGQINIKLWRKGAVVYDQNTTLKAGKTNVFVYDYEKEPILIDNEYPYFNKSRKLDLDHFDSDTVASVRLINFLFEEKGQPYQGKLQYQYRQYNTKDTIGFDTTGAPITEYRWVNLGDPVAFGESTARVLVPVDKVKGISASGFNSSGSQRLYYRLLVVDETKPQSEWQVLQGYWSSSTKTLSNYSDYWTAYIGRVYNHILGGIRTSMKNNSEETYARVVQWTSL